MSDLPQTELRHSSTEYVGPPREWFVSPTWFQHDLDAIFLSRWNFAGHVEEIAKRNSYITYALGKDEVVIRKDSAGEVRAFHNVCSHRGARLCQDAAGTMGRRIVCPYHAWSFEPDGGALVAAPEMHQDFDKSAWGLLPAHVEVWNGLIFVNLAPERPASVADYLGSEVIGPYDFSRSKVAATKRTVVNANWKVVMENDRECYHCLYNHPELTAVQDWLSYGTDPDDFDSIVDAGIKGSLEVQRFTGFDNLNTVEDKTACQVPFPTIGDIAATINAGVLAFPGFLFAFARDYAKLLVIKPLAADQTEVIVYWFVAAEAEEGKHYVIEEVTEFWAATYAQDKQLCENVQRGMEMRAYRPGPLNRIHQSGQAGFYGWYSNQIEKWMHSRKSSVSDGCADWAPPVDARIVEKDL